MEQQQQFAFGTKISPKPQQRLKLPDSKKVYAIDPDLSAPIIGSGYLEPDNHLLLVSTNIHRKANIFLRFYKLGQNTSLTASHFIDLDDLEGPPSLVKKIIEINQGLHVNHRDVNNNWPMVQILAHSTRNHKKKNDPKGEESRRSSYILRLSLQTRKYEMSAFELKLAVTFIHENLASQKSKKNRIQQQIAAFSFISNFL